MKTLVLAAITIAAAYAVSVYDVVLDEWRLYKITVNRHFRSSDEEYDRLQLFLQSKDLVARHNERYAKGLEDYHIGLNHFADRQLYEHLEQQNVSTRFMEESAQMRRGSFGKKFVVPDGIKLPDSVDWNARGAVNAVVNQQTCGSCYAMTSAAALEAQIFMKYHVLPRLSVQQILDCSRDFGNEGCSGGTFNGTFEYLKTTGLAQNREYPYENSDSGHCRVEGKRLSDSVKTYYNMHDGDEEKLKYAVAMFGPAAVGINASPRTFQLYRGGIYSDKNCDSRLVHAMLLTGYGTDPQTNKDYWIIKNTWGTAWGEDGYIKLARNAGNMCGIGTLVYVPKLD